MTITEMHDAFKMELDKSSSLQLPSFEPEEIDYWLNRAIRQFVKNRFTGTDRGVGFEQISKRAMDLSVLVEEETLNYKVGTPVELTLGTIKDNSYIANLERCAENLWFIVGEEVEIAYLSILDSTTLVTSGNLVVGNAYKVYSGTITHDGVSYGVGEYFEATLTTFAGVGTVIAASDKKQGVTECTVNTYRSHIDNPYSEHRLHYEEAKPLRLIFKRYAELITDGNYGILSYSVRYVKQPVEVSIGGSVDCELPDHTHDEIVVLAADLALENIEQPRFKSHQVVLNKVE